MADLSFILPKGVLVWSFTLLSMIKIEGSLIPAYIVICLSQLARCVALSYTFEFWLKVIATLRPGASTILSYS